MAGFAERCRLWAVLTLEDTQMNIQTLVRSTAGFTLGAAVLGGLSPSFSEAATLAYWRMEQYQNLSNVVSNLAHGDGLTGSGGTPVDPRPYLYDNSGNGNLMQIFDTGGAEFYNGVPAPTLGDGTPNTLASFHWGRDYYTDSRPINSANLSGGWTIEASIMAQNLDAWQVWLGKDSNLSGPGDFQIKLNPFNDEFFVEFRDSSDTVRSLYTGVPATAGTWYDLVATADYDGTDTTLSLYFKPSTVGIFGPPIVSTFAGGAFRNATGTWTIGRGMWDGGVTDFVQGGGGIDEVRISSGALAPEQFLMNVPEPSALALIGLGAMAMLRRRR
jgi:hypothetical protein